MIDRGSMIKEVEVKCYLLMETNEYCRGIRFKLPSGEYVGIDFKPHAIKLLREKKENDGSITAKVEIPDGR